MCQCEYCGSEKRSELWLLKNVQTSIGKLICVDLTSQVSRRSALRNRKRMQTPKRTQPTLVPFHKTKMCLCIW